jgi:drug/metabolite transporter (DMT)-like permease
MGGDVPRAEPRGIAMVAIAAIGWGTWPLFLRAAEQDGPVSPALEAFLPMLALTLASGALLGRDRVDKRASPRDWAAIVLLGVADAVNIVTFFAAYQRTSVAVAVVTHYLAPLLVALGAPLVVRERQSPKTLAFVAISLVGLLLLLAPWSAQRQPGDLVGAALGSTSAACYATNVLVSKRLTPTFSGSEIAFFHGAISSALLALLVPPSTLPYLSAHATTWLIAGAALPGATSGLLFLWGLRRIGAARSATLTLLEPTVATLLASIALHQWPGAHGLVGIALVVGGAFVVALPSGRAVAPGAACAYTDRSP